MLIPKNLKICHVDLRIESVGFNPLESVLGAEKWFSAIMDITLQKECGPLGTVTDHAVKKEYQKGEAFTGTFSFGLSLVPLLMM